MKCQKHEAFELLLLYQCNAIIRASQKMEQQNTSERHDGGVRGIIKWLARMLLDCVVIGAVWCLGLVLLSMIPGCGKISDAVGSVWMGRATLVGNGVLVGVDDGKRTHIVFLTARHVATCNGFFRCPSIDNAVYLRSRGSAFKHSRIANIAPERWFCTDEALDLAWFELTEEELTQIAGEGKLPPYVALDAGKAGDGIVAEYDENRVYSLGKNDRVDVAKTVCYPGFETGISLSMFSLMRWSLMFTETESAPIDAMWQRENVEAPHNVCLRRFDVSQNVILMRAHESDSGAPIFARGVKKEALPNFVGILISKNDAKGIGGFQSVHTAVRAIRESVLKKKGLRLSNEKRFW